MSGTKNDTDKPKMSLLDPWFLWSMARNMAKGEAVYGGPEDPKHWTKGLTYNRIIDAMDRHTAKIKIGEMVDPDSGEPHAAAIACGAMMLNYFDRCGRNDLDDRRFKEMCGAMQAEAAQTSVQPITTDEVRLDVPQVLQHQESTIPEKEKGDVTFEDLATRSIETLQDRIAKWANSVFPDRTPHNALQKLVMEEIPELLNGGLDDPLEYGDVLILILDVAYLRGIDAIKAAHDKMEINENRHWARDRRTGLMHHIRELEPHTSDITVDETGPVDDLIIEIGDCS